MVIPQSKSQANLLSPPQLPKSLIVADGESLIWGQRTYVMGIINVSPDSFAGDGIASDLPAVIEQALRFQAEGADLLDIGAQSTRPGHTPISVEEELARLLPALNAIVSKVALPISVDTYRSQVASPAVETGASLINDIWGLKADPKIAEIAAHHSVPLILMHNQQGTHYKHLLPNIFTSLRESILLATGAGVEPGNIILDPGIGFGKTPDQNLEVLRRLEEFRDLGHPLLLGTSRKSTIGRVLNLPVDQRVEGTAATVALSIAGGADIVRVHDVKKMVRVCQMTDAIVRNWRPAGWMT